MRKTYLLDTSVLLDQPEAVLRFADNDVVIPLAVLEEIDSMKRHLGELGSNARLAIRFIAHLKTSYQGNWQDGVAIDNGVVLIIPKRVSEGKGYIHPTKLFEREKLETARTLRVKHGPLILVSKDVILRLKAEEEGILAEDFRNPKYHLKLVDSGCRDLIVEKREIDHFMKDGFLPYENDALYPNSFVHLKASPNSEVLAKYNSHKKRLEFLQHGAAKVYGVSPKNHAQRCALELLLDDRVPLVALVGTAGTGKTLLALASAMQSVFEKGHHQKLLVARPIMPLGKDIGYLPGSKEEKLLHWMRPLADNMEYLCHLKGGNSRAATEMFQTLMGSPKMEMESVTYIRGRTFPSTFMIIDEAQNLTSHEVKTVISRAGMGTKVVLTGDPSQIDHPYLDEDSNALSTLIGKLRHSPLFGYVVFKQTERSPLAQLAATVL